MCNETNDIWAENECKEEAADGKAVEETRGKCFVNKKKTYWIQHVMKKTVNNTLEMAVQIIILAG